MYSNAGGKKNTAENRITMSHTEKNSEDFYLDLSLKSSCLERKALKKYCSCVSMNTSKRKRRKEELVHRRSWSSKRKSKSLNWWSHWQSIWNGLMEKCIRFWHQQPHAQIQLDEWDDELKYRNRTAKNNSISHFQVIYKGSWGKGEKLRQRGEKYITSKIKKMDH